MAPGGKLSEMIRMLRFPLIGDGRGVWSFIHFADAAEATVEHGSRGVYNIVDDDRARVAEWPAAVLRRWAKKPIRVPRFAVRLFAERLAW